MLINLGSRLPFTDSFRVCQATRKTAALHSTLLDLLGEKSGRWSSSPCHGAFSNRSCAHRFAPKWSALTAPGQRSTRLPELHGLACALCNDQILESWMNVACACDETRSWSIAKTCSHAVSAHAVDFETKLETSRRVHWQRWPPPPFPVYAPDGCKGRKKNQAGIFRGERERERQTDRETDRQTDRKRERASEIERENEREREREREREKEKERERDRGIKI